MSDSNDGLALDGHIWKPRAQILMGPGGDFDVGSPPQDVIPWCLSFRVQKRNWFSAGRIEATFALWGNPDFAPDFWALNNSINIDVRVEFLNSDTGDSSFHTLIRGIVDKIEMDMVRGKVKVTGRDFFSFLTDTRVVMSKDEMRIKDVVREYAALHGLTPVFDDGVDGDYGRVQGADDKLDWASLGDLAPQLTKADLLCSFAQQTGASMFVEGTNLYFITHPDGEAYPLVAPQPTYEGGVTRLSPTNATGLSLEHDLVLAGHNHQFYLAVNRTDLAQNNVYKAGEDGEDGKTIVHGTQWANKKDEHASDTAQHQLDELMAHEFKIDWTVAGPQLVDMTLRDVINFSGTNSPWDGEYMVDTIEHSLDFRRGFNTHVTGRRPADKT